MVTITRRGTLLIYDFEHPSEQSYVNNLLAIKNPAAFMIKRRNKHMARWDGMIRHLKKIGDKWWSYAGFLDKVTQSLNKEGVEVNYIDDYLLKPIKFEQLLKPDQKGVKITLDGPQIEACEALLKYRLCCMELETGGGKTELACNAVACYLRDNPDGKVLFLVPRLNLMYQTQERMELRSGLKVGMVGDGHFETGCSITVATSATACGREHLKHGAEIKEWLKTLDMVILDECVPYGTLVLTDDGVVEIGEVVLNNVGKMVLSSDENGLVSQQPIISRSPMGVKELWEVSIIDENGIPHNVEMSGCGKMWANGQYIKASDLCAGMSVLCTAYFHDNKSTTVYGHATSKIEGCANVCMRVRGKNKVEHREGKICHIYTKTSSQNIQRIVKSSEAANIGNTARGWQRSASEKLVECQTPHPTFDETAMGLLRMVEKSTGFDYQCTTEDTGHPEVVWEASGRVFDVVSPIHLGTGDHIVHSEENNNEGIPGSVGRIRAGSVVDGRRVNLPFGHSQFQPRGAADNLQVVQRSMVSGSGAEVGQEEKLVVRSVPDVRIEMETRDFAITQDISATCDTELTLQIRTSSAHPAIKGTIISVRRTGRFVETFDIGVANNHNFFANEVLIHNCHRAKSAPYQEVVSQAINAKHVWAISAKVTYSIAKDKQFELEGIFGPPVFQGTNPDRTVPVIIKHHKHLSWKGEFDNQELFGNIQDEVPAIFRDPETGKWEEAVWRGPDSEGQVPKWMLKQNPATGKWKADKAMYGLYRYGSSEKITGVESDAVVYMTRHDVGIMTFDARNKWAASVALEASRAGETFIITVRRKRHALRILRELKAVGLSDAVHIGGHLSGPKQVEAAELLRSGKVSGAVAVITTVTEGLDIPGLTHVIRCDGQAEEQLLTQVCGRVQRRAINKKYGYVHVPADEQHKDLRKTASSIISYYKKQGREIEEVIWQ